MLTTILATILLAGGGHLGHEDLNRPVPPKNYNSWKTMTKFLNEVKAFEKASKKAGKFGKEEKEWAEEQVEFFGMRSHMLMMRGGDDGEIDQQQYRDAIKHRKEMEPLVDPNYIGTQWSFIGPRGLDGSTSCQFGPVTGRVNTVAYSHQDPNNDYWVGGATGGVFKTADNGDNWTSIKGNLGNITGADADFR